MSWWQYALAYFAGALFTMALASAYWSTRKCGLDDDDQLAVGAHVAFWPVMWAFWLLWALFQMPWVYARFLFEKWSKK